ncbi:DUF4870 family protein [Tepidicaulis sp.]|jgi:uncharacterized membrane protein|uniref:DUF4870 family protein n=1 Tax=Tepidicaulis sp. TaxID=1920809 RepID=UPI003B5A961E
MSDSPQTPNPSPGSAAGPVEDADGVKLVYILYFLAFVIGISAIAGVIVAYLKRGEASAVSSTHYTFQIRTFWIGLLFSLVGVLTSVILVGWLVLLFLVVWLLVRNIKGFMAISDNRPIPEPETWLW